MLSTLGAQWQVDRQPVVASLQDGCKDSPTSWSSHPWGVPSHTVLVLVCVTDGIWQKC